MRKGVRLSLHAFLFCKASVALPLKVKVAAHTYEVLVEPTLTVCNIAEVDQEFAKGGELGELKRKRVKVPCKPSESSFNTTSSCCILVEVNLPFMLSVPQHNT